MVPENVARLSRGDIPILEAGMSELVREGLDSGRLRFVMGAGAGVEGAEFVDLCVVDKVRRMAGGSVQGKVVAGWGLTFKARTDDLRQSPALEVLHRLRALGAGPRAYDPAVPAAAAATDSRLDGIEVASDPYGACEGAAVLVVLTEWDEFRRLDFTKVGRRPWKHLGPSTPATFSTPPPSAGAASPTKASDDERPGRPVHVDSDRPGGRSVSRVVVTGGAGFLGSHLCRELLERGGQVSCSSTPARSTTPPSANRASPWPGRCRGGSQRSASRTGWPAPPSASPR